MVVLRGRRAAWKGPFFQPFNLKPMAPATPPVTPIPAAKPITTTTTTTTAKGKKGKSSQTPNNNKNAPVTGQLQLRTHARNCTILPSFVGHTFHVHTGKDYAAVKVTEDMIGHRLGEFAFTKKVALYAGPKKQDGPGRR